MKKLIKAMNIKYLIIAPILIAISVIAETWTPVNNGPSRSPFYNQVQFWNAVISTNGAGDTVLNTATSYDPILAMNSILMTDGSGTYAIACRPLNNYTNNATQTAGVVVAAAEGFVMSPDDSGTGLYASTDVTFSINLKSNILYFSDTVRLVPLANGIALEINVTNVWVRQSAWAE